MDKSTIGLLRHAAHEIRQLRQSNVILGAQVEAVNAFKAALLGRAPSQGMGEDIAWRLDREADAAESAEKEGAADGR